MDMIWFIIIAVMVLSFVIQQVLNSKFNKYSKVGLHSGLTGAQVAARMLEDHGITDVSITCIKGKLTDHYNPVNKTVNLSEEVYYGNSVAAAAVAAHECGHVVQHATGYAPLKLRSALVPVVSFSSNAVQWVLLIGVMIIKITPTLLYLGIAMFALTTLFSVVTLPVEINASARAVQWLDKAGITGPATKAKAVDALKWAAYTYVIAAIGSIATLIYSIAMARRR